MQLSVNGTDIFVATGGREFDSSQPTIVLLHGAGFDHTTWALHSRWFAHHGFGVLAPDLPGHGRSSGAPLPTIADMADWTAALLDASGATKAWLVGHSMGSLIALETAARHPAKVTALSLIGTAAIMTVGPDLLKAAEANEHAAIDMVSIWGLGFQAELGGSLSPGLWMHSGAQRVLGQWKPGVLFNELDACNGYQRGFSAAEKQPLNQKPDPNDKAEQADKIDRIEFAKALLPQFSEVREHADRKKGQDEEDHAEDVGFAGSRRQRLGDVRRRSQCEP